MLKKILYLSFSQTAYSINAVYIKGLRQGGIAVLEYSSTRGKVRRFFDVLRYYVNNRYDAECIIVGYDSPGLVIVLKLLSRKKIIYNALCSVYERLVVSRGLASRYSLKALYYWLLDYGAMHMADVTMLESEAQIEYCVQLFRTRRAKFIRAWTGVDDGAFFYDPMQTKYDRFTVIFRGRLLPESGAEYAVRAAKLLEESGIEFILHVFGQELPPLKQVIDELQPQNLKLITDFLSIDQVRTMMQRCHVSLGQLSTHDRLKRTIPHKAYESLALSLPYLTARNRAVLELFTENETCLTCNPGDPADLAAKILWAKEHPYELAAIAENGHKLFLSQLTPAVLAQNVLSYIAS